MSPSHLFAIPERSGRRKSEPSLKQKSQQSQSTTPPTLKRSSLNSILPNNTHSNSNSTSTSTPNNHNSTAKNVQFMDLKQPAPYHVDTSAHSDSTQNNEYEAILEECELEIERLEKLNATLTANVVTLTAAALNDNGGDDGSRGNNNVERKVQIVEVAHCQSCGGTHDLLSSHNNNDANGDNNAEEGVNNFRTPKQRLSSTRRSSTTTPASTSSNNRHFSMDITPNEEYTTSTQSNNNNEEYDDNMILTEEHYLNQLSKLSKQNHKLQQKLENKKKLVGQLSKNLQVAAEKIREFGKEKEYWKSKFEKEEERGNNKAKQTREGDGKKAGGGDQDGSEESMQSSIHAYYQKMQVLQKDLTSLLQMMHTKRQIHARDREHLLDVYRSSHEAIGKLEKPEETMHRIIQNLRRGDVVKDWEGYAKTSVGAPSVVGASTASASAVVVSGADNNSDRLQGRSNTYNNNGPPREEGGGGGVNIWDSVTSLFGSPTGPAMHHHHPQMYHHHQGHQQQQQQQKQKVNKNDSHNKASSFSRYSQGSASETASASPPAAVDSYDDDNSSLESEEGEYSMHGWRGRHRPANQNQGQHLKQPGQTHHVNNGHQNIMECEQNNESMRSHEHQGGDSVANSSSSVGEQSFERRRTAKHSNLLKDNVAKAQLVYRPSNASSNGVAEAVFLEGGKKNGLLDQELPSLRRSVDGAGKEEVVHRGDDEVVVEVLPPEEEVEPHHQVCSARKVVDACVQTDDDDDLSVNDDNDDFEEGDIECEPSNNNARSTKSQEPIYQEESSSFHHQEEEEEEEEAHLSKVRGLVMLSSTGEDLESSVHSSLRASLESNSVHNDSLLRASLSFGLTGSLLGENPTEEEEDERSYCEEEEEEEDEEEGSEVDSATSYYDDGSVEFANVVVAEAVTKATTESGGGVNYTPRAAQPHPQAVVDQSDAAHVTSTCDSSYSDKVDDNKMMMYGYEQQEEAAVGIIEAGALEVEQADDEGSAKHSKEDESECGSSEPDADIVQIDVSDDDMHSQDLQNEREAADHAKNLEVDGSECDSEPDASIVKIEPSDDEHSQHSQHEREDADDDACSEADEFECDSEPNAAIVKIDPSDDEHSHNSQDEMEASDAHSGVDEGCECDREPDASIVKIDPSDDELSQHLQYEMEATNAHIEADESECDSEPDPSIVKIDPSDDEHSHNSQDEMEAHGHAQHSDIEEAKSSAGEPDAEIVANAESYIGCVQQKMKETCNTDANSIGVAASQLSDHDENGDESIVHNDEDGILEDAHDHSIHGSEHPSNEASKDNTTQSSTALDNYEPTILPEHATPGENVDTSVCMANAAMTNNRSEDAQNITHIESSHNYESENMEEMNTFRLRSVEESDVIEGSGAAAIQPNDCSEEVDDTEEVIEERPEEELVEHVVEHSHDDDSDDDYVAKEGKHEDDMCNFENTFEDDDDYVAKEGKDEDENHNHKNTAEEPRQRVVDQEKIIDPNVDFRDEDAAENDKLADQDESIEPNVDFKAEEAESGSQANLLERAIYDSEDEYNPKEGKSYDEYDDEHDHHESNHVDEPDAAVTKIEVSPHEEMSRLNDVLGPVLGPVAQPMAVPQANEIGVPDHGNVSCQEPSTNPQHNCIPEDRECHDDQISVVSEDAASNKQLVGIKEDPTVMSTDAANWGIPSSINAVPCNRRTSVLTQATGIPDDDSQARINWVLEDKLINANTILCHTLEKIKDQSKAKLDGSDDEDRSVTQYHNVVSKYTDSGSVTCSVRSKNDDAFSNRLSRRDLFQNRGSSCSDLYVDIISDFDKPEYRQVLVTSRDIDKYLVPRYNPPVLPPQSNKRGAPSFKKGQKDGYYIYKSSSGNEYAGHWKDGRRHGYGMAKYRDGEVFNGEWRRGRRHGHGVLHLANSEVFDGDWVDNKKSGLGVYYWKDGEVDVSWYHDDVRLESLRWTDDRRRAYLLDLSSSKKEQISLVRAAAIVKGWERKRETFDC